MRIRITFSKNGSLRYSSHLDLHRIWERTCRRAGIPLSYSQGFHPQPRISLGAALPLGFFGQAEMVDIWLDQDVELKKIINDLQGSAPPGLNLTSIQSVDIHESALQTQVQSADYEIVFLDSIDSGDLSLKIKEILSLKSILRQRRGKEYDLRPLIETIEIKRTDEEYSPIMALRLKASPSATGRPEEVLAELGVGPENTRITRIGLNLK